MCRRCQNCCPHTHTDRQTDRDRHTHTQTHTHTRCAETEPGLGAETTVFVVVCTSTSRRIGQRSRGGPALSPSNSSGRIFSVPGHGGLHALLRNTLLKQIEASNTGDRREGGPSSVGQAPTTCFKVKRIWQSFRVTATTQATS